MPAPRLPFDPIDRAGEPVGGALRRRHLDAPGDLGDARPAA
ncbi:hypothetical protein [Nocardioides convexus]|nr:hypothetical protein [Nocardioides convexus]